MNDCCPISGKKVDENQVRLSSLIALCSAILFIFSFNIIIPIILSIDFFLKGFIDVKFSIVGQISKSILSMINKEKIFTDAAPKVFAAKIAFLCFILACIFSFFHLKIFAIGIMVIYCTCASLESFFNFCVGCKIYSIFIVKK